MFKSLLAPGRSIPQIPGLLDRGAACAMRHILSGFGSGWQGLDPEFSFKMDSIGHKSFMMTIKKGEEEVGFMNYAIKPGGVAAVETTEIFEGFRGQGLGKSMYGEAMKHARSQGAIHFRSDIKIDPKTGMQSVSEDAQNLWKSAERSGLATKVEGELGWSANLMKLDMNLRKIMDLGEGAAISKAGTGTVSAVLKATSRIAKNVL